uniref:Uncharacterized protein n=1 Tax=Anguilla anguilla TaxID=7936 RepID=A0A0E9QFS5_ANGAN
MVVERDTSQLSLGNNKTKVHNFFYYSVFSMYFKTDFSKPKFPTIKVHPNCQLATIDRP